MAPINHQNTIYLTPEEDKRIRTTVQDRLKKCQELAGQPRAATEPEALRSQVISSSLFSGVDASQNDTIKAFAIGKPYPPCTSSVQDLKPMKLSELCIDTHYRGRFLSVRRVTPVVTLVGRSWTIIEDELSGEQERLEMVLHKTQHGEEILELAAAFRIKEPYFTLNDQGEPTILIDHVSDLVIRPESLRVDASAFERGHVSTKKSTPKTASEGKDAGNKALKGKDFILAHSNYSQGLQLSQSNHETITKDLYRNRAYINLLLNRFDEAKSDALSSLTDQSDDASRALDSKAYSRAALASYNLPQYEEAKHLYTQQLSLTPDDKEATIRLRATEERIKEQETGVYDLKKLKTSLLSGRPRVDAAGFTKNVKIGDAPSSGRGLFTNRTIKEGEIIMAEKPFRVIFGHEREALTAMTYDIRDDHIRISPAGLTKSIVEKLRDNPSQVEKVLYLYGDYTGTGKKLITTPESGPVVDSFQIHDIVARNAFGPSPAYTGRHQQAEDGRNASAGLWVTAAYINHSCLPNAKKEYIGDLMIIRALCPLSAGEEIFHAYDESVDYETRAAALMNTWGFECGCDLCAVEKGDSEEVRRKRRELVERGEKLMAESGTGEGKVRLGVVVRAKKLVKGIEGTYDDGRYRGFPKRAAERLRAWLKENGER